MNYIYTKYSILYVEVLLLKVSIEGESTTLSVTLLYNSHYQNLIIPAHLLQFECLCPLDIHMLKSYCPM